MFEGKKKGLKKKLHKFQECSHQWLLIKVSRVQTSFPEAPRALITRCWAVIQKNRRVPACFSSRPCCWQLWKTVGQAVQSWMFVAPATSSSHCHYLSSNTDYTLGSQMCLILTIFSKGLFYSASCSYWLCSLPGFSAWKTQIVMALRPVPHSVPIYVLLIIQDRMKNIYSF